MGIMGEFRRERRRKGGEQKKIYSLIKTIEIKKVNFSLLHRLYSDSLKGDII